MSKDLVRGAILVTTGIVVVAIIEKASAPTGKTTLAGSVGTFFTSIITAIMA